MAGAKCRLLREAVPRIVAIPFVIALVSFWSTSNVLGQEWDPGEVTMESQTDRGGSDLDMSEGGQASDCQKKCAMDERCQAYTWVQPGYQGAQARCYLKHSVPNTSPCPQCVSGVKKAFPRGLDVKLYYKDFSIMATGVPVYRVPRNYPYRWSTLRDGDVGITGSTNGFYHIELLPVGNPDAGGVRCASDRFKLPAGAICGFHHTGATPGRTCIF
jgi:hypothetical protein